MRSLRRPAAVLAALALTASLAGCGTLYQYQKATEPMSTAVVMPEAQAVAVDARTDNGRIVIIEDPTVTDTLVSAEAMLINIDRAERFTIQTMLDAEGTLVVRPIWPDGDRLGNERCNVQITVPTLHDVVAESSNGSITIKGGKGTSSLNTSNGSVSVEDRVGDLQVRTSNGRIQIVRASGELDLRTSNGSVSVAACAPTAGAPYDWRVSTSNGSIRLDLDQPLEASLRAKTSNSTAKVERVSSVGRRTLVSGRSIQLDGSRGNITLGTSNGSITIRTP